MVEIPSGSVGLFKFILDRLLEQRERRLRMELMELQVEELKHTANARRRRRPVRPLPSNKDYTIQFALPSDATEVLPPVTKQTATVVGSHGVGSPPEKVNPRGPATLHELIQTAGIPRDYLDSLGGDEWWDAMHVAYDIVHQPRDYSGMTSSERKKKAAKIYRWLLAEFPYYEVDYVEKRLGESLGREIGIPRDEFGNTETNLPLLVAHLEEAGYVKRDRPRNTYYSPMWPQERVRILQRVVRFEKHGVDGWRLEKSFSIAHEVTRAKTRIDRGPSRR